MEGEESAAQREVRARSVYERGFTELRAEQAAAKEEALMLLEAWRHFESTCTAKCASSTAAGLGCAGASLWNPTSMCKQAWT